MATANEPSVNRDRSSAAPILALRIRAVADARRHGDLKVLAGELDLLAEAAARLYLPRQHGLHDSGGDFG